MNFWTQLTNSMVFITNIALDASTVQMSFPAPHHFHEEISGK